MTGSRRRCRRPVFRGRNPGGARGSALLAVLLALSPALAAVDTPTVDETLRYLGFDADDKERVLAGEIVARDFREDHEKELAAAVAVLVPRALDDVAADLRRGELLHADRDVLSFRFLSERAAAEEFAGIGYTPAEGKEVRRLLGAEPGSVFNLSEAEIGRFQGLGPRFPTGACDRDPECAAAVVGTYREILRARVRSYRDGGLEAIAPYFRGHGERAEPGAELRDAAEDATLIEDAFPAYFAAYLQYPRKQGSHVESQFLWLKHRVEGRPTLGLTHRLFHVGGDMLLVAERQFYSGQSYNSQQIFLGGLPDGDRTFVFYTNRTFTDQIAGFAGGLRRALGRRKMIAAIVENFEDLRDHLHPAP